MNSFIRSLDITFAQFNYLTRDTIFRSFVIPEGFLYLYSKILLLNLRTSFLIKRWTLISLNLKHHLLHLLEYLCANYVISIFNPSRNCVTTRRIHMYHVTTLRGVKWHKCAGCAIVKQSLQWLYMIMQPHAMWNMISVPTLLQPTRNHISTREL